MDLKKFFKKSGSGDDESTSKKPEASSASSEGAGAKALPSGEDTKTVGRFGGLMKSSASEKKSAGSGDVKSLAERLGEKPNAQISSYLQNTRKKLSVCIALDTTGSMSSLIDSAKESIAKVIEGVAKEASDMDLKVQLLSYKDYGDGADICTASDFSGDSTYLLSWLQKLYANGGNMDGLGSEAVEAPLAKVLAYTDAVDVMVIAGDAKSHDEDALRTYRSQFKTAQELAKDFGKKDIPIYTFVVGDRRATKEDFRIISENSQGQSGMLGETQDFESMLILAILKKAKGTAGVQKYLSKNALTGNSKAFGQLLLGEGK